MRGRRSSVALSSSLGFTGGSKTRSNATAKLVAKEGNPRKGMRQRQHQKRGKDNGTENRQQEQDLQQQ